MPFLVHAVPLTKNWLGVHYWKPSRPEVLPVELEYLSYHEFVDRFVRLNVVALPPYPAAWLDAGGVLLLACFVAATTVGIMRPKSSLAILWQSVFFLLPIVFLLWVKLRRRLMHRTRKKFKHQSQKLLRAWTAQDTMTHAIQWKLRLRPKSVASRWLGNGEQPRHDRVDAFGDDDANNDTSLQQQEHSGTVTLTIAQALQMDYQTHASNGSERQDATLQQEGRDDQGSAYGMVAIPVLSTATSRPVGDVYQALHISTQTHGAVVSPSEPGSASPESAQASVMEANEAAASETESDTHLDATAAAAADTPSSPGPRRSAWATMEDRIQAVPCFAHFFQERTVWLIEISVMECHLDEYMLTVPSPVYCDYRLPAYSDTMLNIRGAGSGAAPGSSRVGGSRYQGEPPAYESESDDGSDTGGDDGGTDGGRAGAGEHGRGQAADLTL